MWEWRSMQTLWKSNKITVGGAHTVCLFNIFINASPFPCTFSPTFGLAPHRLHPRNMIPPLWLPRSTHPQPRCVLTSPFLSACTSLLATESRVKADSSAVISPICVTCYSVRGPNVAKLKVEKDPQNEDKCAGSYFKCLRVEKALGSD